MIYFLFIADLLLITVRKPTLILLICRNSFLKATPARGERVQLENWTEAQVQKICLNHTHAVRSFVCSHLNI